MMKKTAAIAILFACLISAALADDIRIVSGIEVNLTPLNRWISSQKGERPLKHWKQFSVVELRGQGGGGDRCLAINEDGESREMIVVNIPPSLKAYLMTLSQQAVTVAALRSRTHAADRAATYADAATPTGASGQPDFVIAAMAERARVEVALLDVKEAKRRLLDLERKHAELESRRSSEVLMIAMFARKAGRFEVWDCGRSKP